MKKLKSLFSWIKKDKKRMVVSAVVLIIAFIVVFKQVNQKSAAPSYQTSKAEKGTIVSSLSVSGQITSVGNMPVTTQTSGIVKNVFVKNGDIVSSGQNLFEITPDQQSLQRQNQAWASYLSAKNNLENQQAALYSLQSAMLANWKDYMEAAQSSSYQNPDGSPKIGERGLPEFMINNDDWLAAEAKYKNQQTAIAQAQASLTSAWNAYQAVSPIVTAPIGGRVEDITLVLGMVINPQTNSSGNSAAQRLSTIKTDANPIASFNLTEVDVSKVKPDQKVTITLDALPDKTFTGKVIGVDKTGVVSSGVTNYPTTVQFDTQVSSVLSNMSATANIILDTKSDVIVIPSAAIVTTNDIKTVRVLQNGKIINKTVETGLSSDTQTEIVTGISEADEVVTGTVQTQTQTRTSTTSPFSSFGGTRGLGGGGTTIRR